MSGQTNGFHVPSIFLLYHYFHPDDVISARLFSDIAVELSDRGLRVTAMPSIRSCHDGQQAYPKNESWNGGWIRRVWRPNWKQASNKGRIGNAIMLLIAWTWRALATARNKREVMIVGTDPILAVLIAIPWRLFRPRAKIIHWCHDLYPHAAMAEGLLQENSLWLRTLNCLLRVAYKRCDIVADLGPCMGELLRTATGETRGSPSFETITPWALLEPETVVPIPATIRYELFGDAPLGLLYSGNLGRAHEFEHFLALARTLRGSGVAFCFAGRGPRMPELKQLVSPEDTNIRFAGFASEQELELRLAAADVHMVSLREEWTGTVVPSKFFGALATGRPVLFAGSPRASIARWIEEYRLGWVLGRNSIASVADRLRQLAENHSELTEINSRCRETYHAQFSKRVQIEKWVRLITASN